MKKDLSIINRMRVTHKKSISNGIRELQREALSVHRTPLKNNLLCEVTTELPAGSEFANTLENRYYCEQKPRNSFICTTQTINILSFNITLY